LAEGAGGEISGEQRSEHRAVGDVQPMLSQQIFDVAIVERERIYNQSLMIAGENWWRANEIVIRHLTLRTATRYRCRDNAIRLRALRIGVLRSVLAN
jgi:hypothetical protein